MGTTDDDDDKRSMHRRHTAKKSVIGGVSQSLEAVKDLDQISLSRCRLPAFTLLFHSQSTMNEQGKNFSDQCCHSIIKKIIGGQVNERLLRPPQKKDILIHLL